MNITQEIIRKLDSLYPTRSIYGEYSPQNFTPGSFSVRQLSASSSPYPSGRQRRPQAFTVRYFPETKRPQEECHRIVEELVQGLAIVSGVRGTGVEWRVTDDVLHFFVNYNAFVLVKSEEQERMTDLVVETKTGG